jgi:hypothetical protein
VSSLGREQVSFDVEATVSNHNSEQDVIDRELWAEVCKRVEEVLKDPKYDAISLTWRGLG